MAKRISHHPLWVFVPKGTAIAHDEKGYYDPSEAANRTQCDCTTVVYRHKRNGRWSPQAFTGHDGVPGTKWRVWLDWTRCTKLKDGGSLA